MNHKQLYLLIFVLIFQLLLNITLSCEAKSKIQNIDSVLLTLHMAKDDTNKVNLYGILINYYTDANYDSALIFCSPALQLAEKLKWHEGKAYIKYLSGRVYWRKGNFDQALKYHFDALTY